MAITIVTTPTVDKVEFRELVVDLLEDFVHGDTSPFKDVNSMLEDYLDAAVDLDPTQKAGIYSDWLKTTYSEINKQAMGTAMDLLKTNAKFELEKYNAESGYNLQVAQEEKVRAEITILGKEDTLKDQAIDSMKQDVLNKKAQYLEAMAKVRKQYGYPTASVDAVQDNKLGASDGKGAIDKQIIGYDKLNQKDILKTMDEKASLMQNAKVPETLAEKKARVELVAEITRADGGALAYDVIEVETDDADVQYEVIHTYTPNNDDTPFNGSWSCVQRAADGTTTTCPGE